MRSVDKYPANEGLTCASTCTCTGTRSLGGSVARKGHASASPFGSVHPRQPGDLSPCAVDAHGPSGEGVDVWQECVPAGMGKPAERARCGQGASLMQAVPGAVEQAAFCASAVPCAQRFPVFCWAARHFYTRASGRSIPRRVDAPPCCLNFGSRHSTIVQVSPRIHSSPQHGFLSL